MQHFAHPLENLLQMGLREGMKVADFGTGSGHYAFSAGHIVGEDGRVYAVDVQKDLLARLRDEVVMRGFPNIETVWADVEAPGGTGLPDDHLDAAILSNLLFQLRDPRSAIQEARRVVKPKGKVLVIDWAGAYGGIGPHEDHVLSEQEVEELLIRAGLHKLKSFRGGPHHYALLFAAP